MLMYEPNQNSRIDFPEFQLGRIRMLINKNKGY